ncbi:hypothetical protein Tco_1130286 [Tanacetum coccineum]
MVLNILGEDLDLQPNSNYTFILERQKGIVQPVSQLFPFVEHGYCVRQIYNNMKQIYRGRIYKDFLWRYATTTIVAQFKKLMDDLKCFNPQSCTASKDITFILDKVIFFRKLSRKGKRVTCGNYGRTWHNQRACIGPRDQQPSGNTKKKSRPYGVQDVEPTEVVGGSSQSEEKEFYLKSCKPFPTKWDSGEKV